MKKIVALGLVASLSLSAVLGGCGEKKESTSPTSGQETKQDETKKQADKTTKKETTGNEPVKLRMMWWGSQNRHERTLKTIELYEKENPNVKIEPEFSGWSGYWEKIAAQTAANSLPDIFQQDYKYLSQYGSKGLLEDLYNYTDSKVLDLTDVPKSNYLGGEVDSKLFGLCIGINALSIAYNERVFADAGVDVPQPDWTYTDFFNAAKAINEKTGVYGMTNLMGDSYDGLSYLARQQGLHFYGDDQKSLGFGKDLLVTFLERELEVANSGASLPADAATEKRSVEDSYVATGEGAMQYLWSNQIIAVQGSTEDPIKMVVPPKGEDQKQNGLYVKPGQFLSVAASSENKEEAVKFLDFFTNSVEANKILLAERGVPVSTKVSEALKPLLEPSQLEMFNYLAVAGDHSTPISKPEPSIHGEISKALLNIYQRTMFGELTPEEAAEQFFAEAEKIFKK